MSNCINVENSAVTFTNIQLDVEKLEALFRRIDEKGEAHCTDPTKNEPDQFSLYIGWWFLRTNTTISPDKKKIEINFGHGNSSHTWRDWKQTLRLVNSLMRPGQKRSWSFAVEDPDMQTGWMPDQVVFEHKPLENA